jgi:hypothetical protein
MRGARNDQIYVLAPRGQLNPAFMIAIPASDVASDVHNMRGFQYMHQIGGLLLHFPPFKTRLELLRSSYAHLSPKCSLTMTSERAPLTMPWL